jgi:hypothetical protein
MNTNKALYWIALTALAFGFSSEYHRGSFAGLHNIAQYTEARFCPVVARAEHALFALGILPTHGHPSATEDAMNEQADQVQRVLDLNQAELDRAMALREAELERVQARVARAQAMLAHTDLARVQVAAPHFTMTKDADHRTITICSKNGRHLRIEAGPDMADLDIDMPDVQVGDQF